MNERLRRQVQADCQGREGRTDGRPPREAKTPGHTPPGRAPSLLTSGCRCKTDSEEGPLVPSTRLQTRAEVYIMTHRTSSPDFGGTLPSSFPPTRGAPHLDFLVCALQILLGRPQLQLGLVQLRVDCLQLPQVRGSEPRVAACSASPAVGQAAQGRPGPRV